MFMNKKLLISILLIVATGVFAGVNLISFTVKSQDGNIVLNWQVSSENNLKNYIVERSTVNGNFVEIAVVQPEADKNYEYIDKTAFKNSDAVYIYQLAIVDNDGNVTLSDKKSVAHNVSSVKRTWGSIKALFR